MKKSELNRIAKTIAVNCASLTLISKEYAKYVELYGKEDAKKIIDLAKELKRADNTYIDSQKGSLVEKINGEMVLRAVFAEVRKEKEFKFLAQKVACQYSNNLSEFVAKWYTDTIGGEPARKEWNEDKTVRTWELKPITKGNAAGILVTCIRNLAKSAKGAKSANTEHKLGEIIPIAEKKNEK